MKIGRNDPCPCGSGKKYKKCCLGKARKGKWSLNEVRGFSTKEILSRLGGLGIGITEADFSRQAEGFYSAADLAENWHSTHQVRAVGYDEDFPAFAALVLWERLTPHLISSERLDDMMQQGYALIAMDRVEEGCRLWLDIWAHLKKRFTPDMKSIDDAEQVFSGLQNLYNWCQDLEGELYTAGSRAPSLYEERVAYCREFCTLFPESHALIIENMKRAEAESYFALGRLEQGEEAFRNLVQEFPASVWVYLGWGDMYSISGTSKAPRDYDRAEELYRLALEKAPDSRMEVMERLEMLEKERNAGGSA